MSKRGLLVLVFILILLNSFTLIYMGKKNREIEPALNNLDEVNEGGENLADKNLTSADDEVASFGEQKISYREWMNSLREAQGREHLEMMVLERLVDLFAEENNFEVNEKLIEREISFLMTMSGILEDDQLAEQKREWAEGLRFKQKLESLLTDDIHISEEEIKSHYGIYKNQYDFSASFQLSHLLVADMETANKVISELEAGAEFSLLAEEYSLDEDTRDRGGYLGYFIKGSQFVPYGYADLISDLSEQSYSQPLNLGNQVAIVYLHRDLEDISFSYEEVKDEIERELAMKKIDRSKRIEELWDELGIDWIFAE